MTHKSKYSRTDKVKVTNSTINKTHRQEHLINIKQDDNDNRVKIQMFLLNIMKEAQSESNYSVISLIPVVFIKLPTSEVFNRGVSL